VSKKLLLLATLATAVFWTGTAMAALQAKVNVANPDSPFPPNKSAEAAIAIDKHLPDVVGAGAFDEVDEAPCGTAESTPDFPCPFVTGVGTSGVYFSFDRGHNWMQPSFTGWTASSGTAQFGTIHTLPWYYEAGLTSDADSAVAFGPRPVNGHFSWANGSRFYYANLVSALPQPPSEIAFKSFERVAVSRIDNPTSPAVVSDKNNWFRPVVLPVRASATAFEDKEQIWADNAESSPHFGNVYVCFAEFRSAALHLQGNAPVPLLVLSSSDGGDTWRKKQITSATTVGQGQSPNEFGISGCTIRTDSDGVVYLFAEQFQRPDVVGLPTHGAHVMWKSFDGGVSWTKKKILYRVTDPCYRIDPNQGRCVEDGIAGARTDLAASPSVDIANGAPTGAGATDEIVNSWADGRPAFNAESVMFSYSTDGGATWAAPSQVPGPGRGFYSAPAISPNGQWVYVANSWWLTPFQETTASPRLLVNTFQRSPIGANGTPTGWSTLVTTPPGDGRGGSANGLGSEFLGDYNYASAVNDYGVGVWTADARNAVNCPAVDGWRQALADFLTGSGPDPGNPPNPATSCPGRFGNIDIWSATTG
jgi:hypothetical protein